MWNLLCLIFLLVSASSPAAAAGPTAIVSKDSLVFEIPLRDVDAEWEWNRLPKGSAEHEWVFEIPMEGTSYVGVVQVSGGPPAVRGELKDLIARAGVYFWGGGGDLDLRQSNAFVQPTFNQGVVRVVFYRQNWVEHVVRRRPGAMILRGGFPDGSRYQERVTVLNQRDPREEMARAVRGPFSPDEYAIYQTVIDRIFSDRPLQLRGRYQLDLDFVLARRSETGGIFPGEREYPRRLGAHEDTVEDYLEKRTMQGDLKSLAALGYNVMENPGDTGNGRCSVRVSLIGFNEARDQAILYCEHSCGGLTAEGEAICLEKVSGEWLVTWRALLWIS
jgi:hypothetical protein